MDDSSEICCYIELLSKMLIDEQFVVRDVEPNYHALFETSIEMGMFYELYSLLANYHGDALESLKESVLLFYDSLINCPHYDLFLKEEVCSITICNFIRSFSFL